MSLFSLIKTSYFGHRKFWVIAKAACDYYVDTQIKYLEMRTILKKNGEFSRLS